MDVLDIEIGDYKSYICMRILREILEISMEKCVMDIAWFSFLNLIKSKDLKKKIYNTTRPINFTYLFFWGDGRITRRF